MTHCRKLEWSVTTSQIQQANRLQSVYIEQACRLWDPMPLHTTLVPNVRQRNVISQWIHEWTMTFSLHLMTATTKCQLIAGWNVMCLPILWLSKIRNEEIRIWKMRNKEISDSHFESDPQNKERGNKNLRNAIQYSSFQPHWNSNRISHIHVF